MIILPCPQCKRPYDDDVGYAICECVHCRFCQRPQPDGWLFPFCMHCGEFNFREERA